MIYLALLAPFAALGLLISMAGLEHWHDRSAGAAVPADVTPAVERVPTG